MKSRTKQEEHVLVTGCNGYIGARICEKLKSAGLRVIGLDRVDSRKNSTLDEFVKCDLADLSHVRDAVSSITSRHKIDHLVNNAAITPEQLSNGYNAPLRDQTEEAFMVASTVNLIAPFMLIRHLSFEQANATLKTVVNITSTYGLVGPRPEIYLGTQMHNSAAYAATKGGLVQLTRYFATMLAPTTRVNAVSPGGIERGQPQDFIRGYIANTPLQRMNTEEDVANAVHFLMSGDSGYITGQILSVDGGWTAW